MRAGAGNNGDIRMREAAEGLERLVRSLGGVRHDSVLGLLIVRPSRLERVDGILCSRKVVPRVYWGKEGLSTRVNCGRCVSCRLHSPPSRTMLPPAMPEARWEEEEDL